MVRLEISRTPSFPWI